MTGVFMTSLPDGLDVFLGFSLTYGEQIRMRP
jgi:hypothetical protein